MAVDSNKTLKELDAEGVRLGKQAEPLLAKVKDGSATKADLDLLAEIDGDLEAIGKVADQSKKALGVSNRIANTKAIFREEEAVPMPAEEANRQAAKKSLDELLGLDGADGVDTLPIWATRGFASRMFAGSAAYRQWLKSVAPDGEFSQGTAIQSPKVSLDVRKLLRDETLGPAIKTLITQGSGTSAGGMTFPAQRPDIVGQAPLTSSFQEVLDLLTRIPIQENAVQWVRITSLTNNAATVAEATDTGPAYTTNAGVTTANPGTKPESAIAFLKKTSNIHTLAHWIPATSRALADAPQLRAWIDRLLLVGLARILATQVLQGDGTGENFLGVYNDPDILGLVALDATASATGYGQHLLYTIRKALTKVQTQSQVATPNVCLINPADAETLDLANDGQQRYIFQTGSGPIGLGVPRVWGLRVVATNANPTGKGMVADFTEAMLFDREQAMISASNSHADFFVKNLVAILAELRAGFGIRTPSAFCPFATA